MLLWRQYGAGSCDLSRQRVHCSERTHTDIYIYTYIAVGPMDGVLLSVWWISSNVEHLRRFCSLQLSLSEAACMSEHLRRRCSSVSAKLRACRRCGRGRLAAARKARARCRCCAAGAGLALLVSLCLCLCGATPAVGLVLLSPLPLAVLSRCWHLDVPLLRCQDTCITVMRENQTSELQNC